MDSKRSDGANNDDDLQQRVIQKTLDEVAARADKDIECCVICLEVIEDPCEIKPCGHANFDYLCALSWLLETPLCPLCKTPAKSLLHGAHGEGNRPATIIQQNPKRTLASETLSRTIPQSSSFTRSSRRCRSTNRRYTSTNNGVRGPHLAIQQRRRVYQHNLYSKHVGSNRISRYRELNPGLFCSDEELASRARMWIRRELQVFEFLSVNNDSNTADTGGSRERTTIEQRRANNAEFLLEYILAVLKSVDIMGSAGQAEDMIADFLGRENTQLFLHELRAWLRSPYTKLEDWDRAVQYDTVSPRPHEVASRPVTNDHFKGDFYRPGPVRSRREREHAIERAEPYNRRRGR